MIDSPLFDNATILQENGREFVVMQALKVRKTSVYLRSNSTAAEHTKTFLRYGDILRGGRMDIYMQQPPHCKRSMTNDDRPVSVSTRRRDVPTLVIEMTQDDDVEAVRAEMDHNQQSH